MLKKRRHPHEKLIRSWSLRYFSWFFNSFVWLFWLWFHQLIDGLIFPKRSEKHDAAEFRRAMNKITHWCMSLTFTCAFMWKLKTGVWPPWHHQPQWKSQAVLLDEMIFSLRRRSTSYVSVVVATHKPPQIQKDALPIRKRSIGFVTWTVFYRLVYVCASAQNMYIYIYEYYTDMLCACVLSLFKHLQIQHFELLFHPAPLSKNSTVSSRNPLCRVIRLRWKERMALSNKPSSKPHNPMMSWTEGLHCTNNRHICPTLGIGSITSSYLFGRWRFSSRYSLPTC